MIYIEECYDRCFADNGEGCTILTDYEVCDSTCPFYKPMGCNDWVKVKRDKPVAIYAPEEYERKYGIDEKDRKHRELYWRIKNVSKRKG